MSEITDELKNIIDAVAKDYQLTGFVLLMTTTDDKLLTQYGNCSADREMMAMHTMASGIARVCEKIAEDAIRNDPGNNTVEA